MFEIEVLRDLEQSGIEFSAYALTNRVERLSRHDLEVLGFRGDIKRSLAFRQTVRGRRRTLVVMMRQPMWDTIDGDTILTSLKGLQKCCQPRPASVRQSADEQRIAARISSLTLD